MLRSLLSLVLGALVTFALFVFMAFLISGGPTRQEEASETPVIDITMDREDAKEQRKVRRVPPPPPPPEQPPQPDTPPPESSSEVDSAMNFSMGAVNTGGVGTDFSSKGFMMQDGDATPIVRIEPRYPVKAARDGKEGWVQLSFTINELGGVEDVKVIKAEPKRLFDREAIRALRKWKYKPKMEGGKALRQPGMTVQLDFKLDGN